MDRPILYSFRRCPYAMRARLAVARAGLDMELREVVLRNKAEAFLAASKSGTVPCLVTRDGTAIDESLDIMIWALKQHDPDHWLDMPEPGYDLITRADTEFKNALDRTKYGTRYPECDPEIERAKAMDFLADIEAMIPSGGWLFGPDPRLADMAILPFVRQFAMIDKARFDREIGPNVANWLDRFLTSAGFAAIMGKYPKWEEGDDLTLAPIWDQGLGFYAET